MLTLNVRRALGALAAAALLVGASEAAAHEMPRSLVLLDFRQQGVEAELHLPLDQLEIGFGGSLGARPAEAIAGHRAELAAYVARHIGATAPDARGWRVRVTELAPGAEDPAHELVARVWMTPPAGAPVRRFELRYDVIQHQLITHKALVSVRSDWDAGSVSGPPEVLGTMGYAATTLAVDRPAGSAWTGFQSVMRLGRVHIAEGTDHLLFLLTLLLPAPLLARGKRWREYAGARRSAAQLLRIVTAFTIGHSITLAAGALEWMRIPSQPVEVLVALSIVVSAVHAIRPIFPTREPWIAGLFGLVHGLAFSGVIAGFGLDASHTALSILAFNLGIEVMQLTIVCITVPWLVLLARTRLYAPLRIAGSGFAAVAALGWVGERALGLPNPVGSWVDAAAVQAGWIVAAVALLAVAATLFGRGAESSRSTRLAAAS